MVSDGKKSIKKMEARNKCEIFQKAQGEYGRVGESICYASRRALIVVH